LSILIFTFTGRAVFSKEPPETTVDNVETNIRTWLDGYGVGVTRREIPDAFFAFGVTLPNGVGVLVLRPKEKDRYIGFRADIELSREHMAIFDKLSPQQQRDVLAEITLEMSRSKATYDLVPPPPPFKSLRIIKMVPITNDLTESSFATDLDEMDSNALLAGKSIGMTLERHSPTH
jgi:hypothetical protein